MSHFKNQISPEKYTNDFHDKEKKDVALRNALDIRKFEIEMYWKRAAYFWTLIGASFAAYGVVQSASMQPDPKSDLTILVSCLGLVFSVGWFCVNRGSKQWQENWENHVDMLEDEVMGPLYKTVLKRRKALGWKIIGEIMAGPGPYSVSRINQIISLFVTFLWIILLLASFGIMSGISHPLHITAVTLTIAACAAIVLLSRTDFGDHVPQAFQRRTKISPLDKPTSSD
jgi:hypothetical protein